MYKIRYGLNLNQLIHYEEFFLTITLLEWLVAVQNILYLNEI